MHQVEILCYAAMAANNTVSMVIVAIIAFMHVAAILLVGLAALSIVIDKRASFEDDMWEDLDDEDLDDMWDGPVTHISQLEELGLLPHAGGLQTAIGYFATKSAQSPAATSILELLCDALTERDVPVEFNQIRHSRGPGGHDPDPFSLIINLVNKYTMRIAIRIDGESIEREYCGFMPEETTGGFGIMIYVHPDPANGSYYFKEISCATHYADPGFDPEAAVDEIHRIICSLS